MTGATGEDKVTGVEGSDSRTWQVVTALTPLRWHGWATWLGLVFAFGSRTSILVRPIIRMRVIALARWTLLPRPGGRPQAMVFETNWAGFGASYIPDLAMTMAFQWRAIWTGTVGFPGPLPVTGLLKFVSEHDCGADHVHTDYVDGATTEIIVSALDVDRRLDRLLGDTEGVGPLEFAERWERFLVDVQERL